MQHGEGAENSSTGRPENVSSNGREEIMTTLSTTAENKGSAEMAPESTENRWAQRHPEGVL